MDLIDRDALLQDMTHRGNLDIGDWHVFDIINEQPTIKEVNKIDDVKLKQITEWLKENVFQNIDTMFFSGEEAYPGDVHVTDIIASLHNLLYEQVTGQRYDYMFHWANKIGSDVQDNIFDGDEIGYKPNESPNV